MYGEKIIYLSVKHLDRFSFFTVINYHGKTDNISCLLGGSPGSLGTRVRGTSPVYLSGTFDLLPCECTYRFF